MSVLKGNTIEIPISIRDTSTGEPIAPDTLDVVVTDPVGNHTPYTLGADPELTQIAPGDYLLAWLGAQAGRWYWFSVATGSGAGTGEGYVDVDPEYGEAGFIVPVAYAPTVEDIARLLPARAAARFTGGTGAPAFPDEARVQAVIDWAVGTVSARLGMTHLAPKFHQAARHLIVLRTALTLEPAAWPEQARPDKSAWEQWKLLYDEDLKGLREDIQRDAADGDDGDGGPETATMPVFSFPLAVFDHVPGSEFPNECVWNPNDVPLFWIDEDSA